MPNVIMHGVKYCYDFKSPPNPKQAIIFIHGAGGSKDHMINQVAQLGQSFLTIALDLPGHGESEGKAANDIKIYSSFIADFAEHVLGSPFFIAGHSMGGAIAMDFALNYPDQLNGLIIIGSGAKLWVNPKILNTFGADRHFDQLADLAHGPNASPAIVEQTRMEMANVKPQVFYQDFLVCNKFDVTEQIKKIKLPALILGAQKDRLTPVSLSEQLAGYNDNFILKIIDDSGHMMMIEEPDLVNKHISSFINNHSSI